MMRVVKCEVSDVLLVIPESSHLLKTLCVLAPQDSGRVLGSRRRLEFSAPRRRSLLGHLKSRLGIL